MLEIIGKLIEWILGAIISAMVLVFVILVFVAVVLIIGIILALVTFPVWGLVLLGLGIGKAL